MSQQLPRPLQSVPDPQTVRTRLAEAVREAQLLRRLLRLSEAVANERQGIRSQRS